MSKIAFIFPGQGSQAIGMGVSVADRNAAARALFEQASELLVWDLWSVCKEGPEDRLRQTHIAQPALYVTGCAAALALENAGVVPQGAAGHRIGEYAALTAAGVWNFMDGLKLVRERGRLMQEAGTTRPGGMAAILGLDALRATEICREAQAAGVVVPVNYNSPEQIVIAGERAAVEKAAALASEKGAKRVIPLNVSGAFHSPLMRDAAQAMRAELSKTSMRDARFPVAMNVDGSLYQKATDILGILARQLDNPVQWVKSVESLKSNGFTAFVECGSGRVLSGLLRRIDKQRECFSTESAEALDAAVEALNGTRRANV